MNQTNRLHLLLLSFVVIVFIWSAINVQDIYLTWALEAAPVIIALPILLFTYKKFKFPTSIYVIITIHMALLLVGAHYSYAKVPLGEWMKDWFGFERNNYDKIGHFMQGFTPALVSVEIIRRCNPLTSFKWISFFSFCISMTVAALYEIIEWLSSLGNPEDTEAFLGTQGYIWDTQSDMFMCLCGAVIAILLLRTIHPWSSKTQTREGRQP